MTNAIRYRRRDWEARLHHALDRVRHLPFSRAEWDCVRFMAYGLDAMTGQGWEVPLTYATDLQAARHLRRAGGLQNIVDAALRPHGIERISPAFAQRGDVVMCEGKPFPSLGIHFGDVVLTIIEGAGGICTLPPDRITYAWHIP